MKDGDGTCVEDICVKATCNNVLGVVNELEGHSVGGTGSEGGCVPITCGIPDVMTGSMSVRCGERQEEEECEPGVSEVVLGAGKDVYPIFQGVSTDGGGV